MAFIGNSNGNSLRQDPVTGFMQPSANYQIEGFTADKKSQFFVLFEQTGNISKSMDAIGLDRLTFYTALQVDPEFKLAYKRALLGCKGLLEQTMFSNGQKPNGYMDRITWLRRHFPEEYNPKTTIEHQTKQEDVETIFTQVTDEKIKNGSMIEVKDLNALPSQGDASPAVKP